MKKVIIIVSLILSSNVFAMKNGVVKFYNEAKGFGLIKQDLSEKGFSHDELRLIMDIVKEEVLDKSATQVDVVIDPKAEALAMDRMIKALSGEGFNATDVEVIMEVLKESGGRHTPFHNKGINQAGIKRNEESLERGIDKKDIRKIEQSSEKEIQKGKKGLNAVNVKLA